MKDEKKSQMQTFKYKCSGGDGKYYHATIQAGTKQEAQETLNRLYHSTLELVRLVPETVLDEAIEKIKERVDFLEEAVLKASNPEIAEQLESEVNAYSHTISILTQLKNER